MNSMSPVSAHWRSSKTRIVVPLSEMRSKKVRHAVNSSPRPPGAASPTPSSERSAGSMQPPLGLVVDELGERRGDPLAGRGVVVVLAQAGAPPDHLAERPERHPLPEGRGAALVPVDVLADAVDVLEELPRQPALADAALAGDREEPDAALARRRVQEVLEQAELVVATHEGRLDALAPALPAALGDHPERPPRRDRCGLALQELLAGRLEGDRPGRGPFRGVSPTRTRPRRRHRLEAGRGVDEVAGHHPLPDGADGHGGLAGQDAGPELERLVAGLPPEVADRVDEVEGRPHGPLGVVLLGDRRAPDGHDGVADELLDRAAVALDDLAAQVEVAGQELADLLGVGPVGARREADEVGEEDADQAPLGDASAAAGGIAGDAARRRRRAARSAPAASRGRPGQRVPHSPQNFMPGGFWNPHAGQPLARRVPHSPQNFMPAGFWWPQAGQVTRASSTSWRRGA